MKKLLSVLLVVMMVLALAGCGKKESNTIKIGTSGPLTGDAAQYGIAVKTGAEIAIEEINALGGLQFELNFLDDKADGEEASKCYAQLVDWGMDVSMVCVTTGSCLAVAQDLQDNGYFGMTPSGSNADIIANKDSIYRMCFADPEQGVAAADYISAKALGTKVAVFYQTDSDYSAGIKDTFLEEAKVKGLEVVLEYGFDSKNSTDFPVAKAQEAGAEIVFLPLYYDVDTKIINACKEIGYAPIFFGVDGFDGALEQEGAKPEVYEGVYYLTPFAYSSSDEATVSFTKKFNEKVGSNPNQFAADGYDVVMAIYQALTNANAEIGMGHEKYAEILNKEFETLTYTGLTGNNMTWNASGAVEKSPLVYRIESGKLVSAN